MLNLFCKVAWTGGAAILLSACTIYSSDGASTQHSLGYTRVRLPAKPPSSVETYDVTNVGLWAGGTASAGIGYSDWKVAIAPSNCVVVFQIQNTEELKKTTELVQELLANGGLQSCIIETP